MVNDDTVRAVDRTLALIEFLREHGPATLSTIVTNLQLPKSTVHRYLRTLRRQKYVVADGGVYRLSLWFLNLGEYARRQHSASHLAAQKVGELAEQTAERAQFIVEEHGRAIYVYQQLGSNAVEADTFPGKRVPIHASAAGLAILSQYPRDRVDAIIDRHGLNAITTHTIDDPVALYDTLEQIRKRGYSINDQGVIEGLRAIGTPVIGPDDTVIGGLSVSGPINRIDGERLTMQLPTLLLGATNELELNLKYQ
jgi:DNA-binding IclR family transcriptional regulator